MQLPEEMVRAAAHRRAVVSVVYARTSRIGVETIGARERYGGLCYTHALGMHKHVCSSPRRWYGQLHIDMLLRVWWCMHDKKNWD